LAPDAKSQLIGKALMLGKNEGERRNGAAETVQMTHNEALNKAGSKRVKREK